MTVPTPPSPRPSCRVACALAAILVMLGGLRLLLAAEPADGAAVAPAVAVTVSPSAPLPGPTDLAVFRATSEEFTATVQHIARGNLCDPVACGFPRVDAFGGPALDWSSLERRASAATRKAFPAVETGRLDPPPAEWVPGRPCGPTCPERLLAPVAFAARF